MIARILKQKKFEHFINNLPISRIDTLSGVEFEKFICELFEFMGYACNLTSTTGDNGIDVIASNKHHTIGIQTKLYFGHGVGNKAVQEAYSGKCYYNLDFGMVITNSYFSKPAINLAHHLNVILIDRNDLITILKSNGQQGRNFITNKTKFIGE